MKINRVRFKSGRSANQYLYTYIYIQILALRHIAAKLICQTDGHHYFQTSLLNWEVCKAGTVWEDGSFREILFKETHPCHYALLW